MNFIAVVWRGMNLETAVDRSLSFLRPHAIRQSDPPAFDLSKINFALAQRFKHSRHKNTDLEMLKAAIRGQLGNMIRLNRTRYDFAEKFEALIESHNTGSRRIEELFEALVKLSNSLNDQQERHVSEHGNETYPERLAGSAT